MKMIERAPLWQRIALPLFALYFVLAQLAVSLAALTAALAAEAQASPTTVVRVARFLKEMPHQGYRLALDRLKNTN